MPDLTPRQLEILQHALGVDRYGQGERYRNHFCAGATDEPACRGLVEMGHMETFTRPSLPYYNCFVTDTGIKAMLENSQEPPKLTRAQKRYRDFLKADTGRPFMEWLKDQAETKHA